MSAGVILITKLNKLEQGKEMLKRVLNLADASQDSRDSARRLLDKVAHVTDAK
jgi:hypothetical protein